MAGSPPMSLRRGARRKHAEIAAGMRFCQTVKRPRVGRPVPLRGEASSTTLALVIHELATNSAKYGALSASSGTLDVSCTGDDDELVITWAERGGPPVVAPAHTDGFGSKLIHRSMAAQLGGAVAFNWCEEGVVVTILMKRSRLAT